MEYAGDAHKLLGYGQMDLQVGEWLTCNDVSAFTYVRHPEQDAKYCVRELLRILGKRFPGAEAGLIWQQVEQYRDHLAHLYGPPEGATGRLEFDLAVTEWYAQYGLKFEKEWHLAAPYILHYARVGHERAGGHWLGLLHHNLVYFGEAGFSAWDALCGLHTVRKFGLLKALVFLRSAGELEKARYWVEFCAWLTGFIVTEDQVSAALPEITAHAGRLGVQFGYPVHPVKVTIDYFQRLEFAGLGPQAIGI
jgi:hypothetical protein